MLLFPNCKVNLGLRVTRRRPDGYHDIETVMIPAGWCDVLEIVPSASGTTTLTVTGRAVDCPPEKNLVMRAYRALADRVPLPPVDIFLRKVIPDGAGLGGGSADAAFTLIGLNAMFDLGFDKAGLAEIAAGIGSDCPFFIYNEPMLCVGTGTEMSRADICPLSEMTLLIAKPQVAVSTKEAYAGVKPKPSDGRLTELLSHPVAEWESLGVHNDFEDSILPLHDAIARIKDAMIAGGAAYSAMTGSGAAVIGLFASAKMADAVASTLEGCDTFAGCAAVN